MWSLTSQLRQRLPQPSSTRSRWLRPRQRYHAALWQALHVIMHPALILAGTINLDKSSHDFFHSHCHSPTPMIIMAHPLTSSNDASSSTSIHCVENYPVHPKEVHPHPSISTLRSTTPLLPTSHSYPPVPSMNNANVPVISIDPLYPPRRRPSPPFRLGEDTLILGPGTRFIGVEERTPAFVRIMIRQDGTSRTFSIKVHHDQIVDPDPRNVRQRLVRVGKAGKSVLVEIRHWIKSCFAK